MPPPDASPAEQEPSHAAGQPASGVPQQTNDTALQWLPASMQWGWQTVRQQWGPALHELRLFLETEAREMALEQAHYHCTGLADWAVRGFFEHLEHLEHIHFPNRIKLLITAATMHHNQEFCSALVAQLHTWAQTLVASVQQVFHGAKPLPAALLEPAMVETQAPAGTFSEPCAELGAPWVEMPAQAAVDVGLVGGWHVDAGMPLL